MQNLASGDLGEIMKLDQHMLPHGPLSSDLQFHPPGLLPYMRLSHSLPSVLCSLPLCGTQTCMACQQVAVSSVCSWVRRRHVQMPCRLPWQ